MKRTTLIVPVVLLLMIVLMSVSCSSEKEGWGGTVEEVDGIMFVRNPQEPYYGELVIELEEDLEIGNEEDSNYQFYNVTGIALDSEENIYVLDSGNHRVQKFDKDGHYLLTLGREGEGPGEFVRLSDVFIDNQDTIYLSDRRRIQIFDSYGIYKDSITFETNINDFFLDADGNVYTFIMQSDDEGSKKYVVKYDKQGKIVNRIAEFSDVEAVQSRDGSGVTVSFKAYHQYNYWPFLFPISEKQFIYAYPSDYVISAVHNTGEMRLKIEKDDPLKPISGAEKEFIIDRIEEAFERRGRKPPRDVVEASCQFPPHRPFFYGMTVDDKGRIYIRKARSVLDESGQAEFDIFSRDGYYLYKTFLSFNPDIIKNGLLYDRYTSEETGEVKIKRYRVMNWDQIKEGIDTQ
jgi:hypothetical protein